MICGFAIRLGAVIVFTASMDGRNFLVRGAEGMLRRNSSHTMMRGYTPGMSSESSRQKKSENQGEFDDEVQAECLTTNSRATYTRGQRAGKSQKRCPVFRQSGAFSAIFPAGHYPESRISVIL